MIEATVPWATGNPRLGWHGLRAELKFLFGRLPDHEPQSDRGEVYELNPDGQYHVLLKSGQSRPHGHDIPSDAVVDNRVVIGVEGINSKPSYYSSAFTRQLGLQQPIVMVHEGVDFDTAQSMARIGGDYAAMKAHLGTVDPSVATTYNLLKQALDQGHDVLLLAHSGGGTVSALACTLLARAGYQLGGHVRVLSMAGAAAAQDYVNAGVNPSDVLYVGDHRDAVAVAGSTYVDSLRGLGRMVSELKNPDIDFSLGTVHDVNTIVPENRTHVDSFLAGGPGGTFLA